MELGSTLIAGDPRLVDHIVGEVKSQGIFDQFRKECIADVDTKPAYQNLRTRVESSVNSFLSKQTWRPDLNKNQLRETLRKHIHDAPYLDAGVERIVDQVVNPKVYSVFMPQIEDVVYKFLGLERPRNRQRNGPCGYKDLLPKDLDPVSPESDKNSLKDVSLDSVDANIMDSGLRETANQSNDEKTSKDEIDTSERQPTRNGNSNETEKSSDETTKSSIVLTTDSTNPICCGKSEDKAADEEDEDDSPTFEPIDIMNLNESNISNDSHLSGISELTSHRSRSPDFSNETSRDNMDFSNQDSQFSKVSSDSRLSIVTDFGSSNPASTPSMTEAIKDEGKYARDNFKAVREFETCKTRETKTIYEASSSSIKDETKSTRRSFGSKETSRDGTTDLSRDGRESREKNRDAEAMRSRTTKDCKREKEIEKKSSHIVEARNDRVKRTKEKSESSSRDSAEKSKDGAASSSSSSMKFKDDKNKETKDIIVGKEIKDLKDMYKEKIRELREKKELTEKEKLMKEATRLSKETSEKRDSSRDGKRDSKDYKSSTSSSKAHCSRRSENKTSKSEGKSSRSESREKGKRNSDKYSKEHRSKNSSGSQCASDSSEKMDVVKRVGKSEKDEKMEKSEVKQDSRQRKLSKPDNGKTMIVDGKRETKSENESREKKRRDDKKNKIKDDHSSLRKNPDDRRSTDRDGSNGSNGKSSQKYNSSSNCSTTTKPSTTSLSKETTTTSNSSSEISDSLEEKQNEKLSISLDSKTLEIVKTEAISSKAIESKIVDVAQKEIILPIKKRPLPSETCNGEIMMKKPKFAKNFQEAKRLVKIRRRMEREKIKRQTEMIERVNETIETIETVSTPLKIVNDDLKLVPDDERVQIIEVCDEEYDEPYPEIKSDFTPEERSQIILGGESFFTSDVLTKRFNAKSTLSEMEMSIRQSLKEMMSDSKIDETKDASVNIENSLEPDTQATIEETSVGNVDKSESLITVEKDSSEIISRFVPNLTEDIGDSSSSSDSTKILDNPEPVLSQDVSKSIECVELTNLPSSNTDEIPKGEIVEERGNINEIVDEKICEEIEKNEKIEENIDEKEKIKKNVDEKEIICDKIEEKVKIEENIDQKEKIEKNVDDKEMICDNIEEKVKIEENIDEKEKIEKNVDDKEMICDKIEEKVKIEENVEEKEKICDKIEEKEKIEKNLNEKEKIEKNVDEKEKIEKNVDEKEKICDKIEEDEKIEENVDEKENICDKIEEKEKIEKIVGEQEKIEDIVEEKRNIDEIIEEKEKIDEIIDEKENIDVIVEIKEKIKDIVEKTTKINEIVEEKAEIKEIVEETTEIKEIIGETAKFNEIIEENANTIETVKEESNINDEIEKKSEINEIFEKTSKNEAHNVETIDNLDSSIAKEIQEIKMSRKENIDQGTCVKSKIKSQKMASLEEEICSLSSDDEGPCLYFIEDNERLEKFRKFMKTLENDELTCDDENPMEIFTNEIASSVIKTMAPPKLKRKYSTSPLTDILLNNTNNNNEPHKNIEPMSDVEDVNNGLKKRKIGRPKKQRINASLCNHQNLSNGENFVMPLSPESDVSATSEKTPSNPHKDEKSRPRGSNQRYTSDDLYKPRPLFSSSSRRSRRSNQS